MDRKGRGRAGGGRGAGGGRRPAEAQHAAPDPDRAVARRHVAGRSRTRHRPERRGGGCPAAPVCRRAHLRAAGGPPRPAGGAPPAAGASAAPRRRRASGGRGSAATRRRRTTRRELTFPSRDLNCGATRRRRRRPSWVNRRVLHRQPTPPRPLSWWPRPWSARLLPLRRSPGGWRAAVRRSSVRWRDASTKVGAGPGPVAPVKASRPAARKRPVRQPPSRKIEPGDRICGACGEGNPPARNFCSRCGTTLAAAEVVKRRWWQRLVPRRRRRSSEAGARPWQSKDGRQKRRRRGRAKAGLRPSAPDRGRDHPHRRARRGLHARTSASGRPRRWATARTG